jgi:hypothetical protein
VRKAEFAATTLSPENLLFHHAVAKRDQHFRLFPTSDQAVFDCPKGQ